MGLTVGLTAAFTADLTVGRTVALTVGLTAARAASLTVADVSGFAMMAFFTEFRCVISDFFSTDMG